MFSRLVHFLESEEEQSPSFIRLVRNILIFVMVANAATLPLVAGVTGENARSPIGFATLTISLLMEIAAFIFVLRGQILPAKVVVPPGLIAAITIIALDTNGLRNTAMLAMPSIIIISAILLGRRWYAVTIPPMLLGVAIIAATDLRTKRIPQTAGLDAAITVLVLIAVAAGITQLLIVRLNESVTRARQSEEIQKRENEQLLALQISLEEKVHERTAELETANRVAVRRARQFSAVAQVMNAISSTQSLDDLLPLVTQVICEQFNVYHTGVFLLDAAQKTAVLRAANSAGGLRMLSRKHSLTVGQSGIVGFVTAMGQPRIALDVGTDSVYFDNPDLPDTRSEIALPLRLRGKIIGALDVQSVEPNAFQPDDIGALSTLADQVSVAIGNAQTIEEAQKSLAEAQSAVGKMTQEAWQVLRPSKLGLGFSYSDSSVKPLQYEIDNAQINEALNKGKTVLTTGPGPRSRLAVPVRLRGQVIGVMQLSAHDENMLTEDAADIAEAVAERLSLAIETATLLRSSQHRADLEKVTANIAGEIGSSSRFETILRTAARELSRALGGSDVIVQIEPAAMKLGIG